mmetsp:Transcript_103154/g.332342  ORF Transcript_103154/g.332342 Transcript_103154/m.332342 type:complete len:271 (+) Transcript_103154:107-919(+)
MELGSVLLPEALVQLRCISLLELLWRPRLEGREMHLLRLGRAIRACARLGQVLLVVIFCIEEGLLEVRRRLDLCLDFVAEAFAGLLQCRLVCGLARLKQLTLVVVHVVEGTPILGARIVALRHVRRRIVRLPEPPQDIHQADSGRVVDDLHRFRMTSDTVAHLLIGRVRGEATSIAHGSGVDAPPREAPDALLAAPEAAVREDADLEALGPWALRRVAEDKVLFRHPHLLRIVWLGSLFCDHDLGTTHRFDCCKCKPEGLNKAFLSRLSN